MSSVVWNFFKKIDSQNVSCNVCGKTYKTSGNTTNLSTHLKNKHHHAFLQLKNKNARSSEVNITPRTSSPVSFTNSTSTITNKPAEIENNLMELSELVSTRWNSCLDMLERFNTLSAIVAKILATRRNAPDKITSSELGVIRDLIILLTPFKQATEEISSDQYVTSSFGDSHCKLTSERP